MCILHLNLTALDGTITPLQATRRAFLMLHGLQHKFYQYWIYYHPHVVTGMTFSTVHLRIFCSVLEVLVFSRCNKTQEMQSSKQHSSFSKQFCLWFQKYITAKTQELQKALLFLHSGSSRNVVMCISQNFNWLEIQRYPTWKLPKVFEKR